MVDVMADALAVDGLCTWKLDGPDHFSGTDTVMCASYSERYPPKGELLPPAEVVR
jgi:hypothetical protein